MPDHATIAGFRQRHEDAIAELFGSVLVLCARAGMVEVGVIAIDGNTAYEHYRAHGRQKNGRRLWPPPKPYTPPDTPTGKINLTDLDSRNVKTRGGYLQGYNAQAAVTAGQIVIAAEISVSSPDFGLLGPVCDAALRELAAIGVTDIPGVLVADTGYWHQVQMDQIVEHGIQVLIPPDAGNRKTPRPGWDGGLYAFMRRVLQTTSAAICTVNAKA